MPNNLELLAKNILCNNIIKFFYEYKILVIYF